MEQSKRLSSLENILALGEKLLTTFDVAELLDSLVNHVTDLLQAEGATLYLVDPVDNSLISQSIHSEGVKEIILRVDNSSIAGHTAVTRKCLKIDDPYADLSVFHPDLRFNSKFDESSGIRTRNIITHPLVVHGELIGVFQVVNKQGGGFNEDDQAMLHNFSMVAAIAIMNARLMERVMEAQASSRNVIENTSDQVIVLNRDRLIIHINCSAADFLKVNGRRVDISGHKFEDVFFEMANLTGEIDRVIEGNLDKAVSNGHPSYVILTEKNFQRKTERVILIVRPSEHTLPPETL